jgi:hypothetical protein
LGRKDARHSGLEPELEAKQWEALSDQQRIEARKQAVWEPIVESLLAKSAAVRRKSEEAGPGFAVAGSGLEALRNVHAILVKGDERLQVFSTNQAISILFFSHTASGNRVHVRHVERTNREIMIQFRLMPYFEKNLSLSLALIPIGKLPAGEYRVEMVQLPVERKYVEMGIKPLDKNWAKMFVCKSFSFSVKDRK